MKDRLKRLLFVFIGGAVVTGFWAGVAAKVEVPSPPGMPSVINIKSDGADLNFLPPRNDGGSPVTDYLIEYREVGDLHWGCMGVSRETQYSFKMRRRANVQFRVRAVNAAGIGRCSYTNLPVKLRDPFEP